MEELEGIPGNMLLGSTEDSGVEQTLERQPSSYKPLETFILDKERPYQQQYGDMYFLRLMRIKPAVERIAGQAWADTVVGSEVAKKSQRVLDVRQGELCWVLGTCYIDMPSKPNILEDVSKDRWISAPVTKQKYLSEDPEENKIMLEDESGRIRLVGAHLDKVHLVTGAIIAALGTENVNGELEVVDIKFPDLAPQPQRWKLSNPLEPKSKPIKTEDVEMPDADVACGITANNNRKVAIVSGLNFSSTDASYSLEHDLLIEFLLGQSLDPATQSHVANVSRLIIAGNSISMPNLDKSSEKDKKKKYGYDASAYNPIPSQLFDHFLAELLPSIPITVMPGPNDPANASFPQQPIHTAMFPLSRHWASSKPAPAEAKSSKPPAPETKWLDLTTNPAHAEVEGWRMLGTSGQNVDDIAKYLDTSDRVGMMEAMCRWRCTAPTAPDTLWSYPFQDNDPFVMEECPHVYFAGSQPEFGTRKIEGPDGQIVRLVLVPTFSLTREVVILDCETLDVSVVSFGLVE